jgi:hypothetical protein
MATKEQAKKAMCPTHKRAIHQSDMPAGYTLDIQLRDKPKVFVHKDKQM